MSLIKKWSQLTSWKKIVVALAAGIAVGLFFGEKVSCLEPIGTVFIRAIQMLIAPLVSTAIICAVISLKDFSRMGKLIGKAFVLYALGMAVAASIGILIANLLRIGVGFSLGKVPNAMANNMGSFSLGDILISFVPVSPVAAFVNNNVIQILCFSMLFGIALKLTGEKGRPIQNFFTSLSHVVFKLAALVIGFAPYGIFALIATVFGRYGLAVLLPLIEFTSAIYLSCFFLMVFFYGGLLLCNRLSPLWFFGNISSPLITSFITSSSAATLPISMRCAHQNLKINPNVAAFLLPLGATLNMNGLAIYLGVSTVFAANLFGVDLNISQYITLVITILFTAVGVAAIPGSALIVMSATMSSVGVPLGALPLIAGVDRFNDMAATMTNMAGDLFVTTLVAKSEKMIDADILKKPLAKIPSPLLEKPLRKPCPRNLFNRETSEG